MCGEYIYFICELSTGSFWDGVINYIRHNWNSYAHKYIPRPAPSLMSYWSHCCRWHAVIKWSCALLSLFSFSPTACRLFSLPVWMSCGLCWYDDSYQEFIIFRDNICLSGSSFTIFLQYGSENTTADLDITSYSQELSKSSSMYNINNFPPGLDARDSAVQVMYGGSFW